MKRQIKTTVLLSVLATTILYSGNSRDSPIEFSYREISVVYAME